ncbi:MAG: hypothetical protein SCH70_01675 [Candidatus Methanoperedens sp.]|nr:hypothetical protein [Candidatus Methanoperedens sp.]
MDKKTNKSKRTTIAIPEGTKIYKFIQKNNNIPHWKILDNLVRQLPVSKEERAINIFEDFVERMSDLYPECEKSFDMLRPLIFKQIIKKESIESYYEELKKA